MTIATYKDVGEIIIRRFMSENELAIQTTIIEKNTKGKDITRFDHRLITREEKVNHLVSYGDRSGRFTTEKGSVGYYWKNGIYLFSLIAADEAKLNLLIDSFDLIKRNSTGRPLIFIFEENIGLVISAIILVALISAIIFLWLIFHYGEVFARRSPPANRPVSSKREIKDRLLQLNEQKLPFSLREDEVYELIAEWKIAETGQFAPEKVSRIKTIGRVRLKLDENTNRVYVNNQRLTIDAGQSFIPSPTFFSGISLVEKRIDYSWGADLSRMSPDEIVEHNFDLRMIKDPVKRIILECGWTYAPAIWWFKTKK